MEESEKRQGRVGRCLSGVHMRGGIGMQENENANLCQEVANLARESFERVRALAKLEAEIMQVRESLQWIPVSESLPESGIHVLLSCEIRPIGRRYVCVGYYAASKTLIGGYGDEYGTEYDDDKDEYFLLEGWYEVIKNWDDFSSVAIGDFVTHWMLLPEPPEGENNHEFSPCNSGDRATNQGD